MTKQPRPKNHMLKLSPSDIKAAMEYAVDHGYRLSRKVRYNSNGEKIYTYKATLKAVRFAVKRKFPLPNGQVAVKLPNQHFGITLVLHVDTNDSDQKD
jgi:hypothetical protein